LTHPRHLAISFGLGVSLTLGGGLGLRSCDSPGTQAPTELPGRASAQSFVGARRDEVVGPRDDHLTSGLKSLRRAPPALLPATGQPTAQPAPEEIPIVDAIEIYERNPRLIPAFTDESRRHGSGPHAYKAYQAWQACGLAYARRQGFGSAELAVPLSITIAYTVKVQREVGQVIARDNIEGGDLELMRCLWNAEEWMHHPFPAPGAVDGTFRWRFSNYPVWVPK
jgi:hypothetical protein